MVKVNKKNKAKNKIFEFLSVFSMTFGIVVGSGIYLKNAGANGVLAQAGKNPYLAISIWVLMAVFCCMMMLAFIEISSSTKKGDHNTLTAWAGRFVGRRYGSLVTILYALIYLPVLIIIGSLFTTSSFFQALDIIYSYSKGDENAKLMTPDVRVTVEIFTAATMLVLFQVLNTYTSKPGKILQTTLSFLKFIPLLTVLIAGITLFAMGEKSSFSPENVRPIKINNVFMTMVPIMFAFDGFLDSAAIQKDCEHKEVVAPAMMTGIIAVSVFYIVISVAIFMGAEDGNILNIFKGIDSRAHFAFNLIITITLLTMVNAYSIIYPIVIRASIEEKFIYSKNGAELSKVKSSWIAMAIVGVFFTMFVASGLLLPNSVTRDQGGYLYTAYLSSDSTIIIVYLLDIPILINMLINRKTKKVEVRKVKGAYFAAVFSSSMLIFMLGFIYYLNILQPLITGKNLVGSIMWFVFIIILVVSWIINESIISKNNIDQNDFYLRLNPKNWFNYNREKSVAEFKNKGVTKNDKGK
ncbi:amino acid permease [Spiroplasma sp. BIUS-1]|uniref:amino acid permease n=1 Tax=Spiroplasma sp. BIUS-1 TaxID=216964 RepID=UPI001398710C|nr:amino acid permease [Spiroplasma sp. BIUS-1]QHX37067.1 basic amino acid/polyamine antiporter, APA family [Spiroplasma sp. BIUS-1]